MCHLDSRLGSRTALPYMRKPAELSETGREQKGWKKKKLFNSSERKERQSFLCGELGCAVFREREIKRVPGWLISRRWGGITGQNARAQAINNNKFIKFYLFYFFKFTRDLNCVFFWFKLWKINSCNSFKRAGFCKGILRHIFFLKHALFPAFCAGFLKKKTKTKITTLLLLNSHFNQTKCVFKSRTF